PLHQIGRRPQDLAGRRAELQAVVAEHDQSASGRRGKGGKNELRGVGHVALPRNSLTFRGAIWLPRRPRAKSHAGGRGSVLPLLSHWLPCGAIALAGIRHWAHENGLKPCCCLNFSLCISRWSCHCPATLLADQGQGSGALG